MISGGGLASPKSLQLGTGSSSISAAINDFKNQFAADAELVAAGLTMSGSATAGADALSFNSATGQTFNVQVSGDSANLLGLGSFLAGNSGEADYTAITASGAYSAATVTGTSTTVGASAGLEISLNGAAATALTSIDLTAGANARAASATSSASVAGGKVDITSSNRNLDITVINNGTATNVAFALSTNQVATAGARTSTITSADDFAGSPIAVSAANHNNEFTLTVDNGTAATITVADGSYATAGAFLTAVQNAITASGVSGDVTAGWDATSNALTFTSATTGATSAVEVGTATYATAGKIASSITSADDFAGSPVVVANGSTNNKFDMAVDGGPSVTITVADGSYATSGAFLTAVQAGIAGSALAGQVTAGYASGTNALTFTSVSAGAGSSVNVSATTANTGLGNLGLSAGTNHGNAAVANTGVGNLGLTTGKTSGLDDSPTTLATIAPRFRPSWAARCRHGE